MLVNIVLNLENGEHYITFRSHKLREIQRMSFVS